MSDRFLDSNVLLYFAGSDGGKAARAFELIKAGGTISTQVLNEVAHVARRKMGSSWDETSSLLADLRGLLRVVPLDLRTHEFGLELAARHELSVWDGMICAAAVLSNCTELLSEDMHDGLVLDGRTRIANPFR